MEECGFIPQDIHAVMIWFCPWCTSFLLRIHSHILRYIVNNQGLPLISISSLRTSHMSKLRQVGRSGYDITLHGNPRSAVDHVVRDCFPGGIGGFHREPIT